MSAANFSKKNYKVRLVQDPGFAESDDNEDGSQECRMRLCETPSWLQPCLPAYLPVCLPASLPAGPARPGRATAQGRRSAA